MSEENGWFWVIIMFVAITCVIVGASTGEHAIHKEAVKQGLAYWSLDNNGHVEFKWINQ
jgi:hypothetical protein